MEPRVLFKTKSIRKLPVSKRSVYGLNAMDRLKTREIQNKISNLCESFAALDREEMMTEVGDAILVRILLEYSNLVKLLRVEIMPKPLRPIFSATKFYSMKLFLEKYNVDCRERFRFSSFDQLESLLKYFQIPKDIRLKKGYRSTGEEVLLISLTRLHFPSKWADLKPWFPGRQEWFMQAAFYWFLDFMIMNWGYLLLNNMEFWKPYLSISCESIRKKLQNLNYPLWRQNHPSANEENGFKYALFIDNTINSFCRPGGNTGDGPAAPRVPIELQQAWYTGWKKLHGMKFQTITLANGMDFSVFGPISCRNNDLVSLNKSNIEADMKTLQIRDDIKYKIFGDSAYIANDVIGTGGGRGMASVRESIEWSYKDLKMQWKYCCTKVWFKLIFASKLRQLTS